MRSYVRTIDSMGHEDQYPYTMTDEGDVCVIELGESKLIDSGNGVTLFIGDDGITLDYSQFHELCCIIRLDQYYKPNSERIELVTEQVNEL